MKNTKKLFVILLIVATFVTLFNVSAMATTFEKDDTITSGSGTASAFLDAAYSNSADNYGGRSMISQLSRVEQAVYHELAAYFVSLANGKTSSTIYTLQSDLSDLYWYSSNPLAFVTYDMFEEKLDLVKIIHRHLIADYPYEMFWYEKTRGFTWDWEYEKDTTTGKLWITSVTISFRVSECYRADSNNYYQISSTAINRAKEAVAYAKEIVAKYEDEGDLEKLEGYGKEICALVSYNSEYASDINRQYGDPSQIIYVFDQDPNTNVVCEGYAKAFKYLCDLSSFDKDISCYLARGNMNGGGHMWNVVQINGKNYLTDITNCDSGTTLNTKWYFLAGSPVHNEITVTYTSAGVTQTKVVTYLYKEQQDVFCKGYLILSETSYHEHRYSSTWKTDGTQHWHECSCGEKTGISSHTSTGDNQATCTLKAACDVCHKRYGELLEHVSMNSPATCTKRAICDNCNKSFGNLREHTYDQQIVKNQYLKVAATCTSKAVYYYSCGCGKKGTGTFEGEYAAHKYTVQNTDEQYLKSPASCTHVSVYYYSCSCGAVGTNTFIYGSPLEHTFDENNECTMCGEVLDIELPEEDNPPSDETPNTNEDAYQEQVPEEIPETSTTTSNTNTANYDMSFIEFLMMIIKLLMALFGG